LSQYCKTNEIADPGTLIEVLDSDDLDANGWTALLMGAADNVPTDAFIEGFVEGALEVFEDIAKEL
jgi:hypothetical protein